MLRLPDGQTVSVAGKFMDNVDFMVEYEDGSTFRMSIASWKLRSGGHVALAIAAEKQLNGEIPKGKIARVKRAML